MCGSACKSISQTRPFAIVVVVASEETEKMLRLLVRGVARSTLPRRLYSGDHGPYDWTPKLIGDREVVGYGHNGQPHYIDSCQFPFPAIRYKECTPEIMALREKERGDWRKLSCDEKKCLYRASFRQTLAELDAPNNEWKSIVGALLFFISFSIWWFYWLQDYVHKPWPKSFEPEARIAQYYRQVALNMNPYRGNYRPPGAEHRVHPKNKEMLEELMNSQQ